MNTKYCHGCKTTHPVTAFSKKIAAYDGLNPYCRAYCKHLQDERKKKKGEEWLIQ